MGKGVQVGRRMYRRDSSRDEHGRSEQADVPRKACGNRSRCRSLLKPTEGENLSKDQGPRLHEKKMPPALYDSFIADYYDEAPLVRQRTQDVAFYRDAAPEFGDPVLELGCGTGRIAMPPAAMGTG